MFLYQNSYLESCNCSSRATLWCLAGRTLPKPALYRTSLSIYKRRRRKKGKTEFCFKHYDRHFRFGTKTDKKHYILLADNLSSCRTQYLSILLIAYTSILSTLTFVDIVVELFHRDRIFFLLQKLFWNRHAMQILSIKQNGDKGSQSKKVFSSVIKN